MHLRHDTDGRAYFRRKTAAGKTGTEAMHCLKRRLSDTVYRQLITDATARQEEEVAAGRVGHPGASAAVPRRRARGVNVQRPTGRTTLTPTNADAESRLEHTGT
ncbi:MAG: hypothetical protein WAK53_08075 [Chromatiaceae bacterium]